VTKKKRKDLKYPCLSKEHNLKKRRFYMDNIHYVKGVSYRGVPVIPELSEEAKQFLNDFNKEYYVNSFSKPYGYDDMHVSEASKEEVLQIKAQIRDVKALRKKIWGKSPNTTTDEDRAQAEVYNEQIEQLEEHLNKVHPRRACEHDNNARNADLINHSRASNEFDLVSWDTLDDNEVTVSDLDTIYIRKFEEDE
jgi:hypothetical protein